MGGSERPSGKRLLRAVLEARWALLAPVIVLGGIYGGVFTPTEASVVAAVYGLLVGLFVYRELDWRRIYQALLNAIILPTPILLPLVVALCVDPIHFGILLVITSEIGFLTPPWASTSLSRWGSPTSPSSRCRRRWCLISSC